MNSFSKFPDVSHNQAENGGGGNRTRVRSPHEPHPIRDISFGPYVPRDPIHDPDWRAVAIADGETVHFVPAAIPCGSPLRRTRTLLEYALTDRDGPECFYCGRGRGRMPMAVDHVRAARRGGSDDVQNLVWACRDCNLLKGDVPAWFFMFWLYGRRRRGAQP